MVAHNEQLARSTLSDFVFQRGHSEWPLPPLGPDNVNPTRWLDQVRSVLELFGKLAKVFLQPLALVLTRLALHTCGGFPPETRPSRTERFNVADVVQERSEPHPPISGFRQTYPLQGTGRALPALSPGGVCWCGFRLADPLPYTSSAADCPALFGDFSITTGPSDFLWSFIVGVCPRTSRHGPQLHLQEMSTRFPGSHAKCFRAYAGSQTTLDPVVFRIVDGPVFAVCIPPWCRRPRSNTISRLNTADPHVPGQLFTDFLAKSCAWLWTVVGACSFNVRLSYSTPSSPVYLGA